MDEPERLLTCECSFLSATPLSRVTLGRKPRNYDGEVAVGVDSPCV
jgi:hypothetical protein